MKKINIIIIIIVLCLSFFVLFRINEDNWICKNGEWVKHGNPSSSEPTQKCAIEDIETNEDKTLILDNFKEGDLLENNAVLQGKIKDNFFFEGSFPIEIRDINNNIIGRSLAKSQTNWMTSDYVEFKTDPITFDKKDNIEGFIIFRKDNPSGLIENDKEIKLKAKF